MVEVYPYGTIPASRLLSTCCSPTWPIGGYEGQLTCPHANWHSERTNLNDLTQLGHSEGIGAADTVTVTIAVQATATREKKFMVIKEGRWFPRRRDYL